MVWFALACAHPAPAEGPATTEPTATTTAAPEPVLPLDDPGLSPAVLAAVQTFPETGFYWPPDDGVWWGTPDEVRYRGVLLSPADPGHRGHCVGVTWEIALNVLEAAAGPRRPIAGLGLDEMIELRRDWFVRELGGAGAAEAVAHHGIGIPVDAAHLVPGDFVQLWYAWGGGHSGVFTGWEVDPAGAITGITYWSVHPALGHAGEWTDPLGEAGVATVYGARLAPPAAWARRNGGS